MIVYSSVPEFYDKIYSTKDYKLEAEQILRLLRLSPTHRCLLDVGCCTGSHALFLSRGALYTGIDISLSMIQHALKKNIKNANYVFGENPYRWKVYESTGTVERIDVDRDYC